MTVYIDQYPEWLGVPKKWTGGGHLLTSNLDELHEFAHRLGLKRSWFQDETFPHYDLTANKRVNAITLGAVPIEAGEFPDDLLTKNGPYRERRARIATVSTQSEVEQFFSSGPPRPEVVGGRHKFVGPDGVERSYQRASNFAFPLVDQYGLNKHRMRQVLLGVAQRPDLLAVLATMDTTGEPDRAKLDEVIETATQVAGSTAAANLGTAIHAALQAADEGKPYPAEYERYVQAYRAELARNGLTVVLCERLVVHPTIGAAGRLDRVYAEANGSHVVGDVKTTDHLELGAHEISVQLAVYQGASHVRQPDGKGWNQLRPGDIRDDYAIVVHVDRETGAVSLYRVDLLIGNHGANLAEQIRGWRKSGPVLLPYVPPAHPIPTPAGGLASGWVATPTGTKAPGGWISGPAEAIPAPGPNEVVASAEQAKAMFDGPTVTGPPAQRYDQIDVSTPADAVAGRQVLIDGVPVSDALTPGQQVASNFIHAGEQPVHVSGARSVAEQQEAIHHPAPLDPVLGGEVPAPALRTAAELLKASTTKAQVQDYCRYHDITEDLAHTKKILVEKLRKAGKLLDARFPEQPADTPSAPAPAVGGPPPPTGNPEDPRDVAFVRLHLGRIKVAATVGELATIREAVLRAGGEQAWTSEMTEAAKARVAEIDHNTAADIANRIRAAQATEALADLYDEVTIGNSVPGNWTPAIDQAAKARLAEINAARPPAPANPFAG